MFGSDVNGVRVIKFGKYDPINLQLLIFNGTFDISANVGAESWIMAFEGARMLFFMYDGSNVRQYRLTTDTVCFSDHVI